MESTRYSGPISMRLESSRKIFEHSSNVKRHENLSVRAELFHVHGQMQRRTDMTKLIVAFRNFANAPTNELQN